MRNRLLLFLPVLCLILALAPVAAAAEGTSGSWGDHLAWSYNEASKTLTISGSGTMPDADETSPPFVNYQFSIEKVVIGSGVTSIGKSAFAGYSNLSSVEVQGDITDIGEYAFSGCQELTNVTFVDNVGDIGDNAFAGCSELTNVTFAGDAGNIGGYAFAYCDKLTNMVFTNKVGNIGESAFFDCDKLSSVKFESDVGNIGESAFRDCPSLSDLQFKGSVGDIGVDVIAQCKSLSSITFGGNVGNIADRAFDYCSTLTELQFNGTVGDIGESAFANCEKLASIKFADNVGNIGYCAFEGCTSLTSFTAQSSTGSIGSRAFFGCTGFHRLLLPEGVIAIGSSAFSGCENLTAIYIPDSVETISSYAFDEELKDIYYGGTEAQWKAISGLPNRDDIPAVHFESEQKFPETKAGDAATLQRLLEDGRNAGLTEIELTSNIDMGSTTLYVQDKSNIFLDLKGHNITSAAAPVFKIEGSLTVLDSTVDTEPQVGTDNNVTYAGGKIIGNGSGTVMDVLFGGSFTLRSGMVGSSSGGDPVIQLSGAERVEQNWDGIESTVQIDGGYVEAADGAAISASGNMADVTIKDGVVLSRGDAVILIPKTNFPDDTAGVTVLGGTVISKDRGKLSCGIYMAGGSSSSIYGGKIIVENGIGVLVRSGGLYIYDTYGESRWPEIVAGGSGGGAFGDSIRELEAGSKVALDQGTDSSNHRIYYYPSISLAERFPPTAYPADNTQELKEEPWGNSVQYTFGEITYYTVTFDPNGGSALNMSTTRTDSSGRITDLPEDPVKTGYVFRGWSTSKDSITGGFGKGSKIYQDTTLYAVWTPVGAHLITFLRYEAVSYTVQARKLTGTDGVLTDWPTPLDGYNGWFTEDSSSATAYSQDHVFTKDTEVYARWAPQTSPPYNITFTFEDGRPNDTRQTNAAGKLESWPDAPIKGGHVFMGWYTEDGRSVDKETVFSADSTLHPRWMPEDGYTVKFFLNLTASDTPDETLQTAVQLPATLKSWPRTPLDENNFFIGWYDHKTDGSRMAVDHRFSGNTNAYAHWIEKSRAAQEGLSVITFDPGDGSDYDMLITDTDHRLLFLPYNTPVREGYIFDGWFTQPNGGEEVTLTTVLNANTTVYAHWKSTTPPDQTYTLTVSGGTGGGSYAEGARAAITADAAPEGKTFDKWTSSGGGSFADAASASTIFTMPANDVTVTASYKDSTPPDQKTYVIYFDPTGGTLGITRMTTGKDGKLSSLPVPVYSGYIFNGWYTAPAGGNYVSVNTVFTGDTMVYAQWIAESGTSAGRASAQSEYAIITPSTTGGTVAVSRERAAKGAAITLTVTPDSGYEMTSLIARDSRWNELALTDRGGGKYTLTMPDRAVTVNVVFTAAVQQQPEYVQQLSRNYIYPGFTDVSTGAWYYEAVKFVYETGLMSGLSGAVFSPNANLSRAQMTQILYNGAGNPPAGSVSDFADVAAGDWYAGAVSWAMSRGIIDGYDGGVFGPYDNMTREEIAVMLWRYAGKPASERELYFSDNSNISTYALPAVRWAVEKGILNGNSNGALVPKGFATRAQVAQMLKNFLGS